MATVKSQNDTNDRGIIFLASLVDYRGCSVDGIPLILHMYVNKIFECHKSTFVRINDPQLFFKGKNEKVSEWKFTCHSNRHFLDNISFANVP